MIAKELESKRLPDVDDLDTNVQMPPASIDLPALDAEAAPIGRVRTAHEPMLTTLTNIAAKIGTLMPMDRESEPKELLTPKPKPKVHVRPRNWFD